MRLYLLISLFLTQALVTSAEQAFLSQEYIQVDTEQNPSNKYSIDYSNGKWKLIGEMKLGDWEGNKVGPPGYLACGISLKIESDQGAEDDTSTNAVEIVLCKVGSWYDKKQLRLNEGDRGGWTSPIFCPKDSYIYGANIQIDARQGDGDDTAVNGIEILCSDLEGKDRTRYRQGERLGNWTNSDVFNGTFVCGGRVRYEKDQGKGIPPDDSALTGLNLRMCTVEKI